MAMIKVTNIPPDTSEDSLLFFFENRRKSGGGSITELEYDPDTQSAVITFEDPEAVKRVLGKMPILFGGKQIGMEEFRPDIKEERTPEEHVMDSGNVLEVRGVSSSTSPDAVEMYFENSRRSGGGNIKKMREEDGTFYLIFEEEEVIESVLHKKHKIEGTAIEVCRYVPPPPPKPVLMYQNKVFIKSLSDKTTKDGLGNFLEAKTSITPTSKEYGELEGTALITFDENLVRRTMAMPTSKAQEVIICDLCVKPTQQFCNNCQLSLCVDCVSKHVVKLKYQPHEIVHFKDRKIQLVFPDCKFHTNQRCEAHCQQCDVPVCLKCILGPHNGHKYRDMSEIFNDNKTYIEKETIEIESTIIPKYKKKNEETESKISIMMTKIDEMEKEKETHRKSWHQEVDAIFNNFGSLMKSIKENLLAALKSHQSKITNQIPDMTQTVQQNKEILKSNNVFAVTNYQSKLEEYRNMPTDIDVKLPSLKSNTVQGRELSLELGEYKASLTQTTLSSLTEEASHLSLQKLLDQVKSITTIPTGVNPLHSVACVGVDEAWVSGEDKTIRRVDIHGSVRGTVKCKDWPYDITVTRQGELVYSDYHSRTVNIVRHGRTETLITTPQGWKPDQLCCTKSGDILVSMCTTDHSQYKIVRYQGHTVKQEIDRDEDGEPIYKGGEYALSVVENNNGDVCASDRNACTVVVVNKSGRVRFRYDGTPARRKKSFDPRHIVTDSMSQIIVADYNNGCLHILDQNGQFLRCVDNCGLVKPCGLNVDSEGRLWVGLARSGEVKVIEYMK